MSGRKSKTIKNKTIRTKKTVSKRLAFAPHKIKGRGGYNIIGKAGEYIGSKAGGALGDLAGKALGSILPTPIASIFGFGDYRIKAQQMNDVYMGNGPPAFDGGSAPIITHREYIGLVSTAGDQFTNTPYVINPGEQNTFPWLSQMATCFEEYKLLGCVFEYKSTSAAALNSTNTALGSVIMSTQYDVNKPNFVSKTEMENYEFTTACSPAVSMLHPIECDPKITPLPQKYVRNGAQVVDSKHFYDLGNFQIATVGQQAPAVIGELWVSYKIQFFKPCMEPPGTNTYGWKLFHGDVASISGTDGSNAPFCTDTYLSTWIHVSGNLEVERFNKNSLIFHKPGKYVVNVVSYVGSGVWGNINNISVPVLPTGISWLDGVFGNTYQAPISDTGLGVSGPAFVAYIDVTVADSVLVFAGSGTTTNCDTAVLITALPNLLPTEQLLSLAELNHAFKRITNEMQKMLCEEEEKDRYVVPSTSPNMTESTVIARAIQKLVNSS